MQIPYREKCVKMRFVPRYIFTKLDNESALRSNSMYFHFTNQTRIWPSITLHMHV